MSKCPALLAVVATANYLPYAKQVFAGAHRKGKWPGDYLLISSGIAAEDRAWFERRGILVRNYAPLVEEAKWRELPYAAAWDRSALDRLNLFREEYRRWRNVVYLDCDVMVNGPLHRLGRVRGFRAQRDMAPYLKWQFNPESRHALTKHGFDPMRPAFCSGVLAFSTSIIEPGTFSGVVRSCTENLPFARFPDQAGMNLFFARSWKRLPFAYGLFGKGFCAGAKPLLVHLAGGTVGKSHPPWSPASSYHAEWLKNAAEAEMIDFRRPVAPVPGDEWRARFAEWFCFPSAGTMAEKLRLFFVARYHETRIRLTDHYRARGWYAPLRTAYRRFMARTT